MTSLLYLSSSELGLLKLKFVSKNVFVFSLACGDLDK